MMTDSQALVTLERVESLAAVCGEYECRYGDAHLRVTLSPPASAPAFRYQWGRNFVDRHVALRVVQTFERPPRRG